MTVESPIFVCGNGSRHFFKELRTKAKVAGPPWYHTMRCKKCTALLVQVITTGQDEKGNIFPKMTAYLLLSGVQVPVPSHCYAVKDAEAVRIES